MLKKVLGISLLCSMPFLLTGCLMTVESNSRPLQTDWNEGEVSQIRIGNTDQDWVRRSFGDPVTRLTYADGTEVWKYRNRSERDTEVGLFLIFNVDVDSERIETLSIEFIDGVVSNFWIEENRG